MLIRVRVPAARPAYDATSASAAMLSTDAPARAKAALFHGVIMKQFAQAVMWRSEAGAWRARRRSRSDAEREMQCRSLADAARAARRRQTPPLRDDAMLPCEFLLRERPAHAAHTRLMRRAAMPREDL